MLYYIKKIIFPLVARQMKTINYQLSSQKCLEEGWTLRAPSPLLEDLGDNVFEPEPLDPAMVAEGRVSQGFSYHFYSDKVSFCDRSLSDIRLVSLNN